MLPGVTRKIPVGLLGATGTVGQRFVERLADHPWFEIACVAASDRSQGRSYSEAASWRLPSPLPERVASLRVCSPSDDLPCRIVFSALDAALAREIEPHCARRGMLVFSNASAHRMDEDVPLLIPEVNPCAIEVLARQRRERGWTGAIVTNANCSTIALAMALFPIHREFGIERVFVTTLQAVSGAGYPGVPSLDILGNVLPDIPEEAEKIERETPKILGEFAAERVTPASFSISAMTYRVPVADGHTESVSVKLRRRADFLIRVTTSTVQPAASTIQPQLHAGATSVAHGSTLTATAATGDAVPLSGLAMEIAVTARSGKSRFEIRLDPADLGRIDVRIDVDRNGHVTSHLMVEKAETLSMLRQDAPQLQRALDDAGFRTGDGGLQFSLRDQSSSGQNNDSGSGRNAHRLIVSQDDTIPAAVAGRTYGRMLGSSSGVDIKV